LAQEELLLGTRKVKVLFQLNRGWPESTGKNFC